MWLLFLAPIFSTLVQILKAKNLFHVYYEVFTYFQKAMIMICAKYVVTFIVSCLFTILSEAEKKFNMSSREKKIVTAL